MFRRRDQDRDHRSQREAELAAAGRAGGAPLLRVPHPRGPGHQPRPRRRVRQVVHHRGPREVRYLIKFIELVQDTVTNIHHPNYLT